MRIFSICLLPLLLLASLAGCELYGKIGGDDTNIEGALPVQLLGEWVFPLNVPSERYVIAADIIEYGYGGGESAYNFKSNIRFVSNFSANSGVIIIEYIDPPSYEKHNGNSFSAIYYRNLTNNTVQLANAINLADHASADTATLEEAIGRFTRLRMGNYVNWSVVQPQWRVR